MTDKNTARAEEVPSGLAVWCSGIKLNPLCEKIMDTLPEGSQSNTLARDRQEPARERIQRHHLRRGRLRHHRAPAVDGEGARPVPRRGEVRRGGVCEVTLDKESTVKAALEGGVAESLSLSRK